MSYYHACPECGLNLDPCEICDCRKEKTATGAGTPVAASSTKAKLCTTNKISLTKENVKCY